VAVFRSFASANSQGDVAAALADLDAPTLAWTLAGTLSPAGGLNWQPAFDLDATTGALYALYVHDNPSLAAASSLNGGPVSTLAADDQPDLVVSGLSFSDRHPLAGQTVTATATVRNDGLGTAAGGFAVRFYRGDPADGVALGDGTVSSSLAYQVTATVSVSWVATGGLVDVTAQVDAASAVAESNEGNNMLSARLGIVATPKVLAAAGHREGRGITLTWLPSATSGIVRYRVYRAAGQAGTYALVGLATGVVFVDDLLSNGVTYRYKVAAEDAYGVVSPLSDVVWATPPWPQTIHLPLIVR
jgi:hypothetical protein